MSVGDVFLKSISPEFSSKPLIPILQDLLLGFIDLIKRQQVMTITLQLPPTGGDCETHELTHVRTRVS